MTPTLVVLETQDFVAASRMLRLWVAEPVAAATSSLSHTLAGCGGMAGSDPGGVAWAQAYDAASETALRGSVQAINAVETLAAMFAQTARNYASADDASSASGSALVDAALATLPREPEAYYLPTGLPPLAGGSSGGGPPGWGLVEDVIGYVWPNGHQDRLRAAAHAWQVSADALEHGAQNAVSAAQLAIADQLPEADDIWRVCNATSQDLRRLAAVHAALGAACEALAGHLDEAHSAIIGALVELAAWTVGIQLLGGFLSIISFGAAEGPTQAAEAARIAKTAAEIGALIERFTASARATAQTIAVVAKEADLVAGSLAGLAAGPLSTAVVLQVRTMPSVLRIEALAAERRLGAVMLTLPEVALSRAQLERKFKHAFVLGVTVERGRAGFKAFDVAAREFLRRPSTRRVFGTYRNQEVVLNYNLKSRVVLLQKRDGTFISAWKLRPPQILHVVRDRSLGGG